MVTGAGNLVTSDIVSFENQIFTEAFTLKFVRSVGFGLVSATAGILDQPVLLFEQSAELFGMCRLVDFWSISWMLKRLNLEAKCAILGH